MSYCKKKIKIRIGFFSVKKTNILKKQLDIKKKKIYRDNFFFKTTTTTTTNGSNLKIKTLQDIAFPVDL